MIQISELELKALESQDSLAPEQTVAIAATSPDETIQLGIWECGPGILNLNFTWAETVYILEGHAVITNLDSHQTLSLRQGSIALFEAGSRWTWRVPWKLKKIFTIVDKV